MEVWRRLLRYQRSAVSALDADLQTERSMSLEEYDVLFQLVDRGGSLRMSDLADAVLVTRSSCTRLVDRMERSGWVERRAVAEDRRAIEVAVTASGRASLRRAALTHVRGISERFVSRLDGRDLADLARILDHLETPRA